MELGLLIFFGLLAAVVLYQLYAVLGRRVGRQPEEVGAKSLRVPGQATNAEPEPARPADPFLSVQGMDALLAEEPGFDASAFLTGALEAHRTIVQAYHRCDREALWPLLSQSMLEVFEAGMSEREAAGLNETVTFMSPTRADLESVMIQHQTVQLSVRFLAELQTAPAQEAEQPTVESQTRRTAEVWSFERPLKSKDPHWRLVHVAAAVV